MMLVLGMLALVVVGSVGGLVFEALVIGVIAGLRSVLGLSGVEVQS